MSAEHPLLIDIREAYERARAPVPDALPAPLFDILAGTVDLPVGALLVVGEDASRAAFGARILRERGYDARALGETARSDDPAP